MMHEASESTPSFAMPTTVGRQRWVLDRTAWQYYHVPEKRMWWKTGPDQGRRHAYEKTHRALSLATTAAATSHVQLFMWSCFQAIATFKWLKLGPSHGNDHPTSLVMHINIFCNLLVSNQSKVRTNCLHVWKCTWYSPVLPMPQWLASSLAQTNTWQLAIAWTCGPSLSKHEHRQHGSLG